MFAQNHIHDSTVHQNWAHDHDSNHKPQLLRYRAILKQWIKKSKCTPVVNFLTATSNIANAWLSNSRISCSVYTRHWLLLPGKCHFLQKRRHSFTISSSGSLILHHFPSCTQHFSHRQTVVTHMSWTLYKTAFLLLILNDLCVTHRSLSYFHSIIHTVLLAT